MSNHLCHNCHSSIKVIHLRKGSEYFFMCTECFDKDGNGERIIKELGYTIQYFAYNGIGISADTILSFAKPFLAIEGIPIEDIHFVPPYRVGQNTLRAILDAKGREVVVCSGPGAVVKAFLICEALNKLYPGASNE